MKRLKNDPLLFLGLFVFNILFGLWAGTPWEDLDGRYYWLIADNFFSRFLFRSTWQPLGFSFLMYPFAKLKISIFWLPVLLSTLNAFLLIKVLAPLGRVAQILLFVVIWFPCWFFMGLTTLTENLFLSFILASLLILRHSALSESKRLFYLGLCFGGLVWTRHAGLFLLPAYLFCGAYLLWQKPRPLLGRDFLARLSGWTLYLIALVMLSNTLNSGSPLRPSRGGHACLQMVGALSTFPYCRDGLAPELCALDTEGKLNSGRQDVLFLNTLQFEESSPLVRYSKEAGQPAVCTVAKSVFTYYLTHRPLQMAGVYLQKLWQHYGSWEGDYAGYHEIRKKSERAEKIKAAVIQSLQMWNRVKPVERLLVFALIFAQLIYFRGRPPASFWLLLLASTGHALGLALNNPFSVLRYQVFSQTLLLLACCPFLEAWVKRSKSARTQSE